jgi:hypothetical protein
MPATPRRLVRHHLLLIEEQGAARVLRFDAPDTAELIGGALASAAGLPSPSGTGPASSVGGPLLRLSLWAIGLAGVPRLAVVGRLEQGPLLLLAPTELEALAIRLIAVGREWRPVVVPVEDGIEADLSAHDRPELRLPAHLGIPGAFSALLCPRCEDHPLHADAVFDDRSRIDGTRICNACGNLEAIRLDRYARLAERSDPH